MPVYFNEIKLSNIIRKSPFNSQDRDNAKKIAKAFNGNRPTIMTTTFPWLFKTEILQSNEFLLVHKNNIPELVSATGQPVRRKKILNFWETSETIGRYKMSSPYIGFSNSHYINVPPGQFAKVYEGNEAILLGTGQHVITCDQFKFDHTKDFVAENSSYIHHNDLHILRVPPGNIAAVTVDNESYILESRKEPYVFRTQQFFLVKYRDDQSRLHNFHPSNTKCLIVGSKMRLLPDSNEVAVINDGGQLKIEEQKENCSDPIIKNSPNARFVGFLSTNLENVEFPSKEVVKKHREQGIPNQNAGYDFFYTQDSVQVGVKFFVSYRIKKPEITLNHLTLGDIKKHIEFVVNADMGNAIQQTSIQSLLSSNMTRLEMANKQGQGAESASSASSSSFSNEEMATNQLRHWQDVVKEKLGSDLKEYGIELVRLNIEEAKILNPEIEAQMSQQATITAKTSAEKASLQASLEIEKAKADQERTLSMLKQKTENDISNSKASSDLENAKLRAQAQILENNTELEKKKNELSIVLENKKQQAKLLEQSPQATLIAIMEQFVRALQNGNFSSALPLSDLSNMLATFLAKITGSFTKNENNTPLLANSVFPNAVESAASSATISSENHQKESEGLLNCNT